MGAPSLQKGMVWLFFFKKSQSIYKTVASTEQAHAAQLTILVINDDSVLQVKT